MGLLRARQFLLSILFILTLGFCFQNCSDVSFENAPVTSAKLSSSSTLDGEPVANIPPESSSEDSNDCTEFQEIQVTQGQSFVVPARTEQKICYYLKLFDAIALGPSQYSSREVRADVISRDHTKGATASTTRSPLILGQRSLNLSLQGQRQVILAGDANASKNLYVDNYVLVEIRKPNEMIYWAAGTADAKYLDNQGLMSVKVYNPFTQDWQPIDFEVHAPAGTSEFEPVDFTSRVPVNQVIDMQITTLDCGGAEHASEAYLIFR